MVYPNAAPSVLTWLLRASRSRWWNRLFGFLVLVSVVLGVWGWWWAAGRAGIGVPDVLFRGALLFFPDSVHGTWFNWQLGVARVTAPLSIAGAAFRGLAELFADRSHAWMARRGSFREVAIGLGSYVKARMDDAGSLDDWLVILPDASDPETHRLRSRGATVTSGELGSATDLAAFHPWSAQKIVVSTGDDSLTLAARKAVIEGARSLDAQGRLHVSSWPEMIVHLRDPMTARSFQIDQLYRSAAGSDRTSWPGVEHELSMDDLVAEEILNRIAAADAIDGRRSVVVVGAGGAAEAVLLQLADRDRREPFWTYERVSSETPDPAGLVQVVCGFEPDFVVCADERGERAVVLGDLLAGNPGLARAQVYAIGSPTMRDDGPRREGPLTVFRADIRSPAGLLERIAAVMNRHLYPGEDLAPRDRVELALAVLRELACEAVNLGPFEDSALLLVPAPLRERCVAHLVEVVEPGWLAFRNRDPNSDEIPVLLGAVMDRLVDTLQMVGIGVFAPRHLVWHEVPGSVDSATTDGATSGDGGGDSETVSEIAGLVTRLGYVIRSGATERSIDSLSTLEVERLAQGRHLRRCRRLLEGGWRRGDVYSDEGRVSPLLAGWELIPAAERSAHRDRAEEYVDVLKRNGLQVVRPGWWDDRLVSPGSEREDGDGRG